MIPKCSSYPNVRKAINNWLFWANVINKFCHLQFLSRQGRQFLLIGQSCSVQLNFYIWAKNKKISFITLCVAPHDPFQQFKIESICISANNTFTHLTVLDWEKVTKMQTIRWNMVSGGFAFDSIRYFQSGKGSTGKLCYILLS